MTVEQALAQAVSLLETLGMLPYITAMAVIGIAIYAYHLLTSK